MSSDSAKENASVVDSSLTEWKHDMGNSDDPGNKTLHVFFSLGIYLGCSCISPLILSRMLCNIHLIHVRNYINVPNYSQTAVIQWLEFSIEWFKNYRWIIDII